MHGPITLVEHYKTYFRTANANSQALKEKAYHLRYKVYHEKYGIDGIEGQQISHDQYDSAALHQLLVHQPSQMVIGYIRLIPFNSKKIEALPIEHYCQHVFDTDNFSIDQLRNSKTGEFSRMVVHPRFRRRRARDHDYLTNKDYESKKNNRFPINYLSMCLTFAAVNLLRVSKLDYGVALMEKSLAIQVQRHCIVLKQIGDPIKLYGNRIPYLIDAEQSYQNIKSEFLELFHIMADEFADNEK